MPKQSIIKPVYVRGKKPVRDVLGRKLFIHAPQLTYEFSSKFWQQKSNNLRKKSDPKDTQILVLTSHQDDVTHVIYKLLKRQQVGKYPVSTTIEQEFPDGELKILIDDESEKAQSLYIISSILNERDFSRVRRVADHYKNTLNAKSITLICPYLGTTREDKNVTPSGDYESSVTSIRAEIGSLSPFIDKMIVIEPHSSATQACAAFFDIPLLPISPWKFLTQQLQKRYKINPGNFVVVRPDKGRNLAASKIGEYLELDYVSFDKVRMSGQAVTLFELSDKEKEMVKGKTCIIYDDEASTMGTVYALAEALLGYGAKALIVCLVHCKFTYGWETKIKHPLFSLVLGTDSRQPIGNINISDNIELASLGSLIIDLIKADIKGINFWKDESFNEMILQED